MKAVLPGSASNNVARRVRRTFWIGCLACVGLSAFLIFDALNARQRLEQAAFAMAQQQASVAAVQINDIFARVQLIANGIAADLSSGRLAYHDIDARMQADLRANLKIDGIAVTFAPYIYDPHQRLYQSYNFVKDDGTLGIINGATYDYTAPPSGDPGAPKTAWYHTPLEHGPTWEDPFEATGAGKTLIEYGVPFYGRGQPRLPAGVVTVDYSLSGMHDLVAAMGLGATGYGYVITSTGTFLAHPISDYVARKTIFEVANALHDSRLSEGAHQALAGTYLPLDDVDPVTGEESWLVFEPITVTHWLLGVVLNKAEFLPDAQATLREETAIVLAIAASLFFVAGLCLHFELGTTRNLWLASSSCTLLCLVVVVVLLVLKGAARFQNGVAVASRTAVNRYLQESANRHGSAEPPLQVPTGILIEALDFPDATSVTINGFIWQRYAHALPSDLIKGVRLAQQFGEQYLMEETQRIQQGTDTVIIWYFGMRLKQAFNPAQFPLDSRDIAVHFVPMDAQHQVVLTPDLDSYNLVNPKLLPGVDQGATINNWQVESSQFSYQGSPDTTGRPSLFAFLYQPELYFSIHVRRNFLGPLLAYVVPGVVAAGMLFAFLISDPKVGDQEEIVSTLGFTAALFFVITVAHTALRQSIAAVGITYLEYLYILLYLAIIFATINAFLVVRRPDLRVFQYRNNLIPRLLYWPAFAGIFMLATLGVFILS